MEKKQFDNHWGLSHKIGKFALLLISLPCILNLTCNSNHEIFTKQQKDITDLLFCDINTTAQVI